MHRAIITAHSSPICMTRNAGTRRTSAEPAAIAYTGLRPMRSLRRPMNGSAADITSSTGTVATAAVRFETPTSFSRYVGM